MISVKKLLTKTLLFSACVLMTAGTTFAQRQSHHFGQTEQRQLSPRLQEFKNRINNRHQFFQPQQRSTQRHQAAKPTETQSRLTAFSSAEYDSIQFVPIDSFKLYWSDTRHPESEYIDKLLYVFNLDNTGLIWYPKHDLFMPAVIDPWDLERRLISIPTDSLNVFHWDNDTNVYNLGTRVVSTLDSTGRVLSAMSWNYMGSANGEKSYKFSLTYNAQGNQTNELWQTWDGAVWENEKKYNYSYDAQGNLTEQSLWDWDDPSSSWEGRDKEIYTYDNQNRLTQRIVQYWTSGTWINKKRFSYTYTGNNRTKMVLQVWNSPSSQWKNDELSEYTYNTSGLRTEDVMSIWNVSAWELFGKSTYEYDASENLTKWIVEERDSSSSWEYDFQSVRDYSGGLLQAITIMSWSGSAMEDVIRTRFDHNSNEQVTLAVLEWWDGVQWASEHGDAKLNFYYEEYDDGVNNDDDSTSAIQTVFNNKSVNIYPNPATSKITVQLTDGNINHIQITNISGQIVFQNKSAIHAAQVTLPVGQLAPGIYYLQVQSGHKKGVKSFVVR